MIRERRFGDDGVGARSPRQERDWDRSEGREEDHRRYLQVQRFPESSEAYRFRASGSAEYDRRRDGVDGDGRLWRQMSSAQFSNRNSLTLQWDQLVEKKPSNGCTPNSNLNSGYSNPGLKSGYNTLHLNPNALVPNGYVNSNQDSRVLHVGPGYASDTHSIGINIEQSYQRSNYLDIITGVPKHLSMDNGRTRTYQTHHGGIKNYNYADTSLGNMGLQNYKDGHHLHFDDRPLHTEEKPSYYSGQPSPYGTPVSNSTKTYGLHEGGIRRSSGILTETIARDVYGQSSDFAPCVNSELQLERLNQQRALLSPVKDMDRAYAYPEMQRSERSYVGNLPNGLLYNEMISGREDCESREFQTPCAVDPIVDIIYGSGTHLRGDSRESMRLHHNIGLQKHEHTDGNIGSYTTEQHEGILNSRSTHNKYETEAQHIGNESLQEDYDSLQEYYNQKRDSGASFYDDRLQMSDDDQDLYETGGIPNQMLMPKELGMQGMSQKMHTRKRAISKKARMHDQNIKPYHNWGASRNKFHGQSCGDEQWADEISEQTYSDNDMSSSLNAPTSMQDPSSRSRSTGRDVKNRLGQHGRDIKKRLGPVRRDIKKRLGPVGRDTKKPIGQAGELCKKHPSRNAHIQLNCHRKSMECDGSGTLSTADSSKVEGKHRNSYPSEDSEEFKLSVHVTFLKFVKLLNENSAHRRRYTEQGGTGILKCGICGSKSKEFVDTKSLAEHALMSRMAGSRAKHLGFHKALCALMGWKSGIASDSHWTPKLLTDAEAMALKEDLIIWPPTIIIHNSSIANKIPAERMIVSTEDLEAILRGNGFGKEKTKVCRGKPANQSIMIVSFPGTLSGLKEAERLHKLYAENNHGRAELEVKCTSNDINSSNSEETKAEKSPTERMENVLFGYLGVAGDLDKLDFETKKRSVVKSKKEIQVMSRAVFN